jgi:sugar (pentulose or hexulose) kinase
MVFCGVDIGTTSTKAVVLDRDGQVLDDTAFAAPAGLGGTAKVYWYEHFCRVMDRFASRGRFQREEIVCSVTGQGGSFVLTDDRCQPVSPACSWTVLAKESIVRDLVDTLGEAAYYHLTGWPAHGWLAACKLRQMVERDELPEDARWIATVPDFIYAQLTGDISTDITSAQITGLADFQRSRWSRDIAAWVGVREELLPRVVPHLGIIAEGVRTAWGKMTLTTGSHDQYAAMAAAGLEKNKSVMLGTGTAWVINGRTGRPLFDDRQFLIHPGRDLHPDCYGFIVTLWQIGAGFDKLLSRLGVTPASLARIEDTLAKLDVPHEPVLVDVDSGVVEPAGDAPLSVRRYMEWAGSVVAYALDRCGLARGLEKIVVTGGAMKSRFWPQIIAGICDLTVEAVDCPHFTAYGAAWHAREAVLGRIEPHHFPSAATVGTYAPQQSQQYRAWYRDCQEPMLERETQR